MAIKKSQLYASLWQSCDELRGGMDASQYKDYILTLLFMKYISDKAENDPYALITVPEGGGFSELFHEVIPEVDRIFGWHDPERDEGKNTQLIVELMECLNRFLYTPSPIMIEFEMPQSNYKRSCSGTFPFVLWVFSKIGKLLVVRWSLVSMMCVLCNSPILK